MPSWIKSPYCLRRFSSVVNGFLANRSKNGSQPKNGAGKGPGILFWNSIDVIVAILQNQAIVLLNIPTLILMRDNTPNILYLQTIPGTLRVDLSLLSDGIHIQQTTVYPRSLEESPPTDFFIVV